MVSPDRLGRYEIRGVLGSGAMGIVYSAWDPELERPVAIKIIQSLTLSEQEVERFRREAQMLARLTHPHIVAVYDIGAERTAPYVVMELVEGSTVASEIARQGSRPLRDKVRLVAEVCDALAFANAAGVVHRDVKPANIIITQTGAAKLADFGVARLKSSSLTATAHLVGTPAYLAPELFAGAEVDARADVYGAAATLFEWACGSRAHQSDNLAMLMAKVIQDDAPDIRERWPGCPALLAECLKRGLAKDPDQRYQTARDFGDALRSIHHQNAFADEPTAVLRIDDAGLAGARRRPALVLLSIALAVSMILGAVLVWRSTAAPASARAFTAEVRPHESPPATEAITPRTARIEADPLAPQAAVRKPAPDQNQMVAPTLTVLIEGGSGIVRDEADVVIRKRFKVSDAPTASGLQLVLNIETLSLQERLYNADVIRNSARASIKISDRASSEVLRRSSTVRANTVQDIVLGQTVAAREAVIALLEESDTVAVLATFRVGDKP